jgi:hypothetical protein
MRWWMIGKWQPRSSRFQVKMAAQLAVQICLAIE